MNKYNVIGLMSGTSLDGVDIAFCSFTEQAGKWSFTINEAETIPYSNDWEERLKNLMTGSAIEFVTTHTAYGHYLGKLVAGFIQKHSLTVDFIASHGHTIFHQPHLKTTSQIGDGAAIAAECGLPVICDFRSSDVALGGQGAPLVPIGDKLLFSEYDYCLNLGGIANISLEKDGKRIAYDICPVNIPLNYLANTLNLKYDANGDLARIGNVNAPLLKALNELDYYKLPAPKSLGKEWVDEYIMPLISNTGISENDLLRTLCEHIAIKINEAIYAPADNSVKRLLITGGGAFNTFLTGCIKDKMKPGIELVIPGAQTINFKEALIFAFLGVLRMRNEPNCLQSVTGAEKNAVGGAIYSGN